MVRWLANLAITRRRLLIRPRLCFGYRCSGWGEPLPWVKHDDAEQKLALVGGRKQPQNSMALSLSAFRTQNRGLHPLRGLPDSRTSAKPLATGAGVTALASQQPPEPATPPKRPNRRRAKLFSGRDGAVAGAFCIRRPPARDHRSPHVSTPPSIPPLLQAGSQQLVYGFPFSISFFLNCQKAFI